MISEHLLKCQTEPSPLQTIFVVSIRIAMEILILSHEICQFISTKQSLVAGVKQNVNREQL